MYRRRTSHTRKRVLFVLFIIAIVLLGFGVVKLWKYVSLFYNVSFKKEIQLKETKENTVNILLLGVGGGTHEGPDLTDTIIFASIDPNTKKVTLISIPRDMWIPEIHAKINAAYTFGEEKQQGGGLVLAKAIVSKLTNQQIDYAVKIDFDGFVKAVDLVGGLDITVDRGFDDYEYPITGKEDDTCGHTTDEVASMSAQIASASASELELFPCRYEHLHFDKGPIHMDGTTALKFVRSRHALGPEGSDFARSKRQQKVIAAFKEKVFSLGIILNPVKALDLFNVVKGSIDTDISSDEYDDFIHLAQNLKGAKIRSFSIDAGDGDRLGLLVNPPISDEYGGAWVLAPRVGNGEYSEIQAYVDCVLKADNCMIGESSIYTPTPIPTKPISKGKK
jgi:polyisoprenyl-teichoic acid--peptidoglycan teichoic acid transferase